MSVSGHEDTTVHRAVVSHEERYSVWPADRELPPGWSDAGKSGPKPEVLGWIEETWTGIRPLSLRKTMDEAARSS